jgi:glycerol-3-phosphate cytidylyltransferase-like family protein
MVVRAAKAVAARRPKDFKHCAMNNYNRDLLVLYKDGAFNEDLLQREVECLHKILLQVERIDKFCLSHELVTRYRITPKTKAILKAVSHSALKPFHFLINKN